MAVEFPAGLPIDSGDRKASSHRLWLLDLLAAARDLQYVVHQLHGGLDGIMGVGTTPSNSMLAAATTPASMAVTVSPGVIVAYESVWRSAETETLSGFTAPVSEPRIDLIEANVSTRALAVKTGAEAASPAEPSLDTNCVRVAAIHWRVGATSIKDADDATNAYIEDRRAWVNM